MALLRHELPAGGAHFDWLLAATPTPEDDERTVICLRTTTAPWPAPTVGAIFPLQRAADHRGLYLRLADPRELDGRGIVRPIARGFWQPDGDETGLRVQVRWSDGPAAVWQFNRAFTEATLVRLLG